MSLMLVGQIIMIVTIILMVSGRTPLYTTAILGSTIAALIAGIPFKGVGIEVVTIGTTTVKGVTIIQMINSGLNSVIADMAGVLMFIGIMETTGFLDVIIKAIIKVGRILGRGPGVAAAGGVAAGIVGALTGFTQPVITGAITGPAAVKLGVNPSRTAGITAHAGHLGNFGGFTHPTQVAVIAAAGISFGMINVIGAITALSIFFLSFIRLKIEEKKSVALTNEEIAKISAEFESTTKNIRPIIAFTPFILLFIGFVIGLPVFIVGIVSGLITIILAGTPLIKGENAMLNGVAKIATPLVATIGFLYMATVIRNVGLVGAIADLSAPVIKLGPVQIMLLVSALTGLLTQSNGASAAVVVPMVGVVLGVAPETNRLALACAAAGGCALMQYFLTGGPVAALATVIPVIPGSELKAANKFQRPSILFGLLVLFIITLVLGIVL